MAKFFQKLMIESVIVFNIQILKREKEYEHSFELLNSAISPLILLSCSYQVPDNQKFGICEALLMVGAWDHAKSILERLPLFAAVSHPAISKGLCKLIHTTIEPLYRR